MGQPYLVRLDLEPRVIGALGCPDPYPVPAGHDVTMWGLPSEPLECPGTIPDSEVQPENCRWFLGMEARGCTAWKLTPGQCLRVWQICASRGGQADPGATPTGGSGPTGTLPTSSSTTVSSALGALSQVPTWVWLALAALVAVKVVKG
jgi:hypothetical protein